MIKEVATIMIMLLVLFFGSYVHEIRHQQIYEQYNITSKIIPTWEGMATTTINKTVTMNEANYNNMMQEQQQNDNTKYNLLTIEMFLALIFAFQAIKFMEVKT